MQDNATGEIRRGTFHLVTWGELMSLMIAAMQKADSADPAKYLPALAGISYDGITAKIQFDVNGDLKAGNVTLYQVQQGKWQALETVQ